MEDVQKQEGMQTTPDLDRIMTDGRPVFTGTAEPDGSASLGPAAVMEPQAAEPPAQKAEQPDAASAEKPAVAPDKAQPAEETPPAGDYRFKSHNEAEKAYRLLQSKTTKAEQRLKMLEQQIEEDKRRKREAIATEDAERQYMEFATERNAQALGEINDLDPEDPEYQKKAAACWARAHLDVRRFQPKAPDLPEELRGSPAAPAASAGETTPQEPSQEGAIHTRKFVETVLEGSKIGISKDDPLFWAYAEQSPSVDATGRQLPLKDQIWWAVQKTLDYRRRSAGTASGGTPPGPPGRTFAPSPSPAFPPAAGSQPMGRSGAVRPAAFQQPVSPASLDDAVSHALEMRRL